MTLTDEKSAITEHDQRLSDIETVDTTAAQKQAYIPKGDDEYNVTFKTWIGVIVASKTAQP